MFKNGIFKEYATYSNMPLFFKKRETSFPLPAVVKCWLWLVQPFVFPAV